MICPHCGRKTDTGEICRYCRQPTEFISRTCSRPGKIPGIEERLVSRSRNPASPSGLLAAILVVAVITCVLEAFSVLQLGQLQTEDARDAPAAQETFHAPDFAVSFDWNLPDGQGADIPPISLGQPIPTLPDTGGLRFKIWNTDPDGSGMHVCPGDPFDLPLREPLTLYAQWEPIPEAPAETEPVPPQTEATLPETEEAPSSADAETETDQE